MNLYGQFVRLVIIAYLTQCIHQLECGYPIRTSIHGQYNTVQTQMAHILMEQHFQHQANAVFPGVCSLCYFHPIHRVQGTQ